VLTSKLLFEAESFMSRGEYDKAIPKLSLFLGIKPYDPVPLIQLARCHLALGNLKTAKDYLDQAAHRDPSNHEIATLQHEIESRLEKTSVSSVLRQAREIFANYTPENEQEAREVLEKVLALDPENAWAREKLGELDLLTTEEHVQETGEKAIDKGIEAMKDLKGPFTAVGNFLAGHITALVLAVVAVLLVFDIRRRTEQRSYPLQGNLSLIPLLDVVSLLNSNLKTGRLVVVTADTRGEIFFEKGEIIHARWKNDDGKKAFNLLMILRSGTYFFNNHLPSIRHTISEPLSLLLLSLKSTEEPPAATATTKQEKTEEPVSV
jgi:tetratricopeptide (TPR) repeat protein